MIDLHCHVLPGIDDGPESIEGSIALARAAGAAGIDTIVATPHVNTRTPNDPATIAALTGEVNARLQAEGVGVTILAGAEVAISHVAEIEPEELSRLSLGGGGWLLVEPPFTPVVVGLDGIVMGLLRDGHRAVLAHPERAPGLRRDRQIVPALAAAGVLMSVTAGSLVGQFGGEVKRYALELAREGLVHNVTSDAHDAVKRPPGIAQEMRQAGLGGLIEWCALAVPEAILAGEQPPQPPAGAFDGVGRRGRRWRLRR